MMEPLNQGSEEVKKPNPTTQKAGTNANADANNLVSEIMQRLGLGQTGNDVSASSASVVSTDTPMFVAARGGVSPAFPSDASMNENTRESVSPQTSSSERTQLNCRPCGGCCGRRFGPRVPVWFARLIRVASEALGKSVCEVVNEFGLCEAIDELQRGGRVSIRSLNYDKWVEKFVSRVGVYKPGYLIVRVRDAPLNEAWRYVVLALHEEYKLNEVDKLIMGGSDRLHIPNLRGFASHPFVASFARELGFNDILELSRFLKALLDNGLIVMDGESVDEVRRVVCRLCGEEIPTLGRPSESIRSIIGHFKSMHGLGTIEEVEAKARELADKEAAEESRPTDPGLLLLTLDKLAGFIIDLAGKLNIVEPAENGYACRLCGREFREKLDLANHLVDHHYRDLGRLITTSTNAEDSST